MCVPWELNPQPFALLTHCSTTEPQEQDHVQDHVLVTPLHTSDHFLLTLNLNMIPDTSHTPPHVTFRGNLRSLSPSRLSAMVSSSLPPSKQLSSLDANSATDTFCSTLTSCLDTFCPLSSRPARTNPSAPWLSDVLREHRSKLRAAERVWHKSQNPTYLNLYWSLLPNFSANVSTAKRTYYHDRINNSSNSRMLFKAFSSFLYPPPPPPSSTLTADDFATFFINKITNLTAQFSTPQSVKHILPANIHSFTSFSPLSEAEVSKVILSNHPTTCPLDPIPSHLLQAVSPAVVPALTHIINTSLHTGIFPSAFKQAHITPLLKKPTLNPTRLENYRPVSLLPFIAKTLERVVFNQVFAFLTQNNLLDSNQSGFRSGHSWTEMDQNCLALSCWSPKTCKSSFQVIITYLAGSVRCFWYGQPPDPPVNTIEKGHLKNHTPVVWVLPLR